MAIFQIFAPHPFFMQVRKRPIQKRDKLLLFTCMRKGLHAPRYKTESQGHLLFFRQNICFIRRGLPLTGYQRLFYSHRKQNTSSAMSTEIDKGEWRRRVHPHNFDKGILFQSNPLFQSQTGVSD